MKKITLSESKRLLPFLRKEKEFNLFIIGDLENAKPDSDYIELFIDGKLENPKGILLRYFKFFLVYSPDEMDYEGAARIIKEFEGARVVSGKEECVNEIKPYLENKIKEEAKLYFATLQEPILPESEYKIKKLALDNVNKVTDLLSTITEFGSRDDETFIAGIKNGSARSYYLEKDGEVVATASTSAETSEMAMIVAVATAKNHRKKGYATAVMSKLCSDLIEEGKSACLFYDNPAAGKIYNRIGFREIGFWKMLRFTD